MYCASYSQATAGIAVQTFFFFFMRFSHSAEELSEKSALLSGCSQPILPKHGHPWSVGMFLCTSVLYFSSLIFFPEKAFVFSVREIFSMGTLAVYPK